MSRTGNALHHLHQGHPDLDLILWKADVSEAYRCMSMHPLWQIKQVALVTSTGHSMCTLSFVLDCMCCMLRQLASCSRRLSSGSIGMWRES